MNIEQLREFCLSLPKTTEDMAFGDDYLLIRVCNRIFACIGLTKTGYFVVKCDPELAIELRERHAEILPAWHWNKKYWNQVHYDRLSDAMICDLISRSFNLVVSKLSRKTKMALDL